MTWLWLCIIVSMTTVSPELTRSTGGCALSNEAYGVVPNVAGSRGTFFPLGSETVRRLGSGGPIGGTARVGAGAGCCAGCCARMALAPTSQAPPMITPAAANTIDPRFMLIAPEMRALSQVNCLGEGKRLARRRRHAKDVEYHRYQDVIAEDADELDGGGVAEQSAHPRESLIADAARFVELLNEIVDCPFVLWGGFRHAPLMQVTNGLRLDAGPLGLRHMGEPFVLRAPESCRDQNREFGEARRHPGIEPAMAA